MMKNILCCVMINFLFFNLSYAKNDDLKNNYNSLMITIQNLGSENCYLTEKNISKGELLQYHSIPVMLAATGEQYEFIVRAPKAIIGEEELVLNYQCGGNKTFSIFMKNFLKHGHWHFSTDATFKATDVFEKHVVIPGWVKRIYGEDGGGYYGNATQVFWSITH